MAQGISINIGLNNVDAAAYDGWDGQLVACEYDANDMAQLASDRDFDTQVLLTAQATSENILRAISGAASALEEGDILLLTYSGHGGQVPDDNSDEKDDRRDETWVAFDRQIVDDELYAAWAQFPVHSRIVVLSDSCHSGSAVRAIADAITPEAFRTAVTGDGDATTLAKALPLDVQRDNYEQNRPTYDAIQRDNPPYDQSDIQASVLLISGCQDNQTSSDGARNGLFTENLLEVWDGGKFKGDYRRFAKRIVSRMPPWQTPNFFTTGAPSSTLEHEHPFTV